MRIPIALAALLALAFAALGFVAGRETPGPTTPAATPAAADAAIPSALPRLTGTPSVDAPTSPPSKPADLSIRLSDFRDWYRRLSEDAPNGADHREKQRRCAQILPLILGDPESFLAFFSDPANADFARKFADGFELFEEDCADMVRLDFETLPPALAKGFLGFLAQGSPELKVATLRLLDRLEFLKPLPDAAASVVCALILDPAPGLPREALYLLTSRGNDLPAQFRPLLKTWLETTKDPGLLQTGFWSLARVERAEAQALLVRRLDTLADRPDVQLQFAYVMREFRDTDAATDRRIAGWMAQCIDHQNDAVAYKDWIYAATQLNAGCARATFEGLRGRAPTPQLEAAVAAILARLRAGETRNEALSELLR